MDFWERVARRLAELWYCDADPAEVTREKDFTPESILEWAAQDIEERED